MKEKLNKGEVLMIEKRKDSARCKKDRNDRRQRNIREKVDCRRMEEKMAEIKMEAF